MSRHVRFAGVTEPQPNSQAGPVKSALKSVPVPANSLQEEGSGTDLPLVGQIFAGAAKIDAKNVQQVLDTLFNSLESGTYAGSENHEPPTMLETYTVLLSILRFRDSTGMVQDRVNEIAGLAKRDFESLKNSQNVLDARILVQIFRVVDLLLAIEGAAAIDENLVSYFLDEAIVALRTPGSSKALIGICIHLFNSPRALKILSPKSAQQLVQIISKPPSFSSAALSAEYISTFRAVLRVHAAQMLANTCSWVPTMIKSLFDNNSFVRQQSLLMLNECNGRMACDIRVARAIHDAFASQDEGAQESFVHVACKKLVSLLNTQGEGRTAMAIWNGVLLAMASWEDQGRLHIDDWKHLGTWLEVTKAGFSSVYLSTKEATFKAWRTAIYILAFNGRTKWDERNLNCLLYPLKMLKSNPAPAIAHLVQKTLVALLFAATKFSRMTQQHCDVAWNSLVFPAMTQFLDNANPEIASLAWPCLQHLLKQQQASPAKPRPKSYILSDELCLDDIGTFPSWWVCENMATFLKIFNERPLSSKQRIEIWNLLLQACKLTKDWDSQENMNALPHLATALSFLVHYKKELGQEQRLLALETIAKVPIAVLVTKRFSQTTLPEASIVIAANGSAGETCALEVLFSVLYSEPVTSERVSADLGTTVALADSSPAALTVLKTAIFSAMVQQETTARIALVACMQETSRQLRQFNSELAGESLHNVIDILRAGTRVPFKTVSETAPATWIKIFEHAVNSSSSDADLIELIDSGVPEYMAPVLLHLKKTVLCHRPAYDQVLSECLAKNKLIYTGMLPVDASDLPDSFKVTFARKLVFSNISTADDGTKILALAIKLLGTDNLVCNADLFVAAMRASNADVVDGAVGLWNKHLGWRFKKEPAKFSEYVAISIQHLYEEGLDVEMPMPAQDTGSGSLKRPATSILSPPVTSSPPSSSHFDPGSPTERLTKARRLNADKPQVTDLRESSRLRSAVADDNATPELSSDEPGAHAMELFNRLHATNDPSEVAAIKEQQSQMVKPRPILSEMADLPSSPPSDPEQTPLNSFSGIGSGLGSSGLGSSGPSGTPARSNEDMRLLKRTLMRIDMAHSLRKGSPGRAECALTEKLLMDTLVSLRIYMADLE